MHSIQVLDARGIPTTALAPSDTFLIDVSMSDPDGFRDIDRVEVVLDDRRTASPGAAYHAAYLWTENATPAFVRTAPQPSTWAVLPSLCIPGGQSSSPHPRTVRFAIVPGVAASASVVGDWSIEVRASSGSEPDPVVYPVPGYQMSTQVVLSTAATRAAFAPSRAGGAGVSLAEPPDGEIELHVFANSPYRLRGRATDLVGIDRPAERIPVGPPNPALRWTAGDSFGVLDLAFLDLVAAAVPDTDEVAERIPIDLFADIPSVLTGRDYAGTVEFRVEDLGGVEEQDVTLPLSATVVTDGLAADHVIAELLPHTVSAGTSQQPFVAYLQPTFDVNATGINRFEVVLPAGFGIPNVTEVRSGTVLLPFADRSVSGVVRIGIPQLLDTARVKIVFRADVPTTAASAIDLPIYYDDTLTVGVPPQVCQQGDANGAADGNSWEVSVIAGPLAYLHVAPASIEVTVGGIVAFAVTSTDAFGNPAPAVPGWRVVGGIGVVDGSGTFTSTTAGSGMVIAQVGAIEDTAFVTVNDIPPSLSIDEPIQSLAVFVPGDPVAEVLAFRISNSSAAPETLVALTVHNRSSGGGGIAQMDASWTQLQLQDRTLTGAPVLLGFASYAGGAATFGSIALVIPAGASRTVAVLGAASLTARDGDVLDLLVEDERSFSISPPAPMAATWPIDPPGGFPIDGMSAAQLQVVPIPATGLRIGSRRNPSLELVIPSNGYAADQLVRLNVVNLGDARVGEDLSAVEAWLDNGDAQFDALTDTRLGPMIHTGDRWEITGLSRTVGTAGIRVFVTVDVADLAVAARTVRFGVPSQPDPGIGMASGNSGPIDAGKANPAAHFITSVDRVTLTTQPLAPATVRPDAQDVPVLALAAGNSYSVPRTLTGLIVTNGTIGPGGSSQLDGEFRRLRLRLDGDANGRLDEETTDPILANSAFLGGRAVFAGFTWSLPPGSNRTLFVTADLSPSGARDGDSLSAHVERAIDVTFDSLTAVAAAWPLVSGARVAVDGMIADQVSRVGAPGVTLGPDDGPIPVFDATVPSNGYATDLLHSFRLVNLGNATLADIAELRLWRDDGDGVFEPLADLDLGPLTHLAGGWQSPYLNETLAPGGTRLFTTLRVTSTPADSATLQLSIPIDGLATESGNHGPIDRPVTNPESQLLSRSALLASLSTINASTLGELVTISMTVRNQGDESITGIVPHVATSPSSGDAAYVTGPIPASANLAPGEDITFTWSWRSTTPGDLRWIGGADGTGSPSGLLRRALTVQSNRHLIFTEAESLACFATQSMPFAVNRGQTDVVPLSLTFDHDATTGSSDVLLRGFRVRLESGNGSPVAPAAAIASVRVHEGPNVYLSRTNLESTGSEMDLTLATPIRIVSGEPVTVGLRLDIATAPTASSFRLVIDDSTQFDAEDATSGQPVRVQLRDQAYPIRSGLARVVAGATALEFSVADTASRSVTRGGADLRALPLRLYNPGITGFSSEVRLEGLALGMVDAAGQPVAVASRISQVRVVGPFTTLASRPVTAADGARVVLVFEPPLTVPLNAPLDLEVRVDVTPGATLGVFRLALADTAAVEARDVNSGDPVAPVWNPDTLAGPAIRVELPADHLTLGGAPQLPAALAVGRTDVHAMDAVIEHPGTAEMARVRVDTLVFRVQDEARRTLAPGEYLDRIRVMRHGAPIGSAENMPAGAIAVPVTLPPLAPGDTDTLSVLLDFEASAPTGFLEVVLDGAGVRAIEPNRNAGVPVIAASGVTLPVSSGVTRLEPPARLLVVDFTGALPPALPQDGSEVPIGTLVLTNSAAAGSGSITIRSLSIAAADRDYAAVAAGAFAVSVRAYRDGTPWASASLGPDTVMANLIGATPLDILPESPVALELRLVARAGGAAGAFRLGIDDTGIGVVQPPSALLSVGVLPRSGRTFPMWTEVASFAPAGLAASTSNFPNPFAAGRERTTFVFQLPAPGRVTLTIWTARGERVRTLLEGAGCAGGLHQDVTWDGLNGRGLPVTNGVYVAELIADIDGGGRERVLRKVMVVR